MINQTKTDLQDGWNDDFSRRLDQLKAEHSDVRQYMDDMLRDKARIKWTAEGDRNTKFYYAFSKARRTKNHMFLQCDDGSMTDGGILYYYLEVRPLSSSLIWVRS